MEAEPNADGAAAEDPKTLGLLANAEKPLAPVLPPVPAPEDGVPKALAAGAADAGVPKAEGRD